MMGESSYQNLGVDRQAQKAILRGPGGATKVQNKPSHSVSRWHAHYFDLKTIEAQMTQHKIFTSPLLPKRN